ncbi:MAG TPA: DUF362 domain-containing protein [Anaerolineaceae bacterium]|nr:DUF362 domain-containing protein [Anaerolineaceae bacterium]HPN50901.1 DUF362 domain-containing protein [Anaerolineaceae bacterium]
MKPITRRQFLKWMSAAAGGALLWSSGCAERTALPVQNTPTPAATAAAVATSAPQEKLAETSTPASAADLSVVHGPDPAAITKTAIAALGGMERFVKPGQTVVIKPNICVDYHTYEYAATTNPDVVGALVTLCLQAGAKKVKVMDMPFGGTPESAYAISGISDAVRAAGGEMEVMSALFFEEMDFPEGKDIKRWAVYRGALDADVLIDVPIAKNHSMAKLTLGGKNLLGLIRNPNQIHRNMGQRVADLVSLFRPDLTVIDAVRILLDNGPTGGNLNDVKKMDTVIASGDIVAADSYATTLFGMSGDQISYIKAAAAMGLGTLDLSSLKIEEVSI